MINLPLQTIRAGGLKNRLMGSINIMQKIGIFGGTFDPVHWGHLLVAESAYTQAGLSKVIWLPNYYPHYKQATLFEHRLEMVALVIASNPGFTIAPNSSRTSTYAIQTLQQLQAAYPHTHWYWILGLDTFQTLPRWYRRRELVPACKWLVAPRLEAYTQPQAATAAAAAADIQFRCEQVVQHLAVQSLSIDWQILQMPGVEVSATMIRQYCRDRHSIRYLVPEPVREYIATHNLYSGS